MPDVKQKSNILTMYERSIFAKIGASVSSLKEQQMSKVDTPQKPKDIDLVKLNSDFMKVVVEPFKTILSLNSIRGKITINPTESIVSLFDKANEPTPIVLDRSDKLLRSKIASTVLPTVIDLLASPKDAPNTVKQIDLTKSPLAQLIQASNIDLSISPIATPDMVKSIDLTKSPIDTPDTVKTIDLLKSPMDTPGKIQVIDLLKSPMDTTDKIHGIDLLKSPMDEVANQHIVDLLASPMDTPGKVKLIDLLLSPMDTPGNVKAIDLLKSPMQFPVGTIVTEDLLKSPITDAIPFTTPSIYFLYGRFGTGWKVVNFFDKHNLYATGFTVDSSYEYSNYINAMKPLGIIIRGHEPQSMLNTPYSILGSVDYFDKEHQHVIGFTANAIWKDSDFLRSDGARIDTPLSLISTNATYEYTSLGVSTPQYNFPFKTRDFKPGVGMIPTDEKNSELYIFNKDSVKVQIGAFGNSFGVGDSGKTTYKGVMALGYRAPQYKIFNPDSKPWYWSRIRESSDAGKGMTGILPEQGNVDKFTPGLPGKTSEFKHIGNSQVIQSLGSTGGSYGVKQGYITDMGIPPQGQSKSDDALFYWSKARLSSSMGIEPERGNIEAFVPKSPFTDYKKDSDFYILQQNSLIRINKSAGLIGAPAKSSDGKTLLPVTDSSNLYKELFGFNLDLRLGVLNQYKKWSGVYSKLTLKNLFKEFVSLKALDVEATPGSGILANSALPSPIEPSTGLLLTGRLATFYTPKINSDNIKSEPIGFGRYNSHYASDNAGRAFSNILQSGLDFAGTISDLLLSSLETQAYRTIAGLMGVAGDSVDAALKTSFPLQILAGPIFAGEKSIPPDTVVSKETGTSGSPQLPSASSTLSKLGGGIPSVKSLTGITQTFGVNSDAVMKQAISSIQSGVAGLISNVVNSLLGKTLLDAEKVLMIRHILDGTKYTAGKAFYDPTSPYYNAYYNTGAQIGRAHV